MERLNIARVLELTWANGAPTDLFRQCAARLKDPRAEVAIRLLNLLDGDAAFNLDCRRPVWTLPRTRRSLMGLLASKPRVISESGVDRRWKVVVDLERENVLHVLSLGGEIVSLAVEPVIPSWAVFNKAFAALYPASIARLASSVLQTSLCPLPPDRQLATLVAERAARLYPGSCPNIPSLADFRDDYRGYLEVMSRVAKDAPWAGHENAQWHVELLPESVRALCYGEPECRFVGILPSADKLAPPLGLLKRMAPPPDQDGLKIAQAESLLDSELDVMGDPIHLLQFVEREARRKLGLGRMVRMYQLHAEGRSSAKAIWTQMAAANIKDAVVLRSWVRWFVRNFIDRSEMEGKPAILGRISGTWSRFSGLRSQGLIFDQVAAPRTIFGHLAEIFSGHEPMLAIQQAACSYGFPIAYAYMCCENGPAESYRQIGLVFSVLETDILGDIAKSRIRAAATAMLVNGKRMGPLGEDSSLRGRLVSIMRCAGVEFSPTDYHEEPENVAMFWSSVETILTQQDEPWKS